MKKTISAILLLIIYSGKIPTDKDNDCLRNVSRDSLEVVGDVYVYKYDHQPYTGCFYEKYDSTHISMKGMISNGHSQGKWTYFYYDGRIKSAVNYNNGKKDGLCRGWYEDGKIESEGNYSNGARRSIWKYYSHEGNDSFLYKYPEKILPASISYEKLNVKTEADAAAERDKMIKYIWGEKGWPADRTIDSIVPNISYTCIDSTKCYTSLYGAAGNLKQIDLYYVKMPNNFVSKIHHFRPIRSNGKVFLYHCGHGKSFQNEDQNHNAAGKSPGLFIPEMLKEGYNVVVIMMPLAGNTRPVLKVKGYKEINLNDYKWPTDGHNLMFQFLEKPYRYFLEPIVAAVNYLVKVEKFKTFYMAGLSGGGWTTTMYAAIDLRIQYSFPTAGTIPLELRGVGDSGDAEQGCNRDEYDPGGLYDIVNYRDLYFMGASGEGRMQIQILNEFDYCCFFGTRYIYWVDEVKDAVKKTGKGRYDFYLDQSHHSHRLSAVAFEVIRSAINGCEFKLSNNPPAEMKKNADFNYQPKIERSGKCNGNTNLIWSLPVNPGWMKADSVSGQITGIPSQSGRYTYSFKAVDGKGGFIIETKSVLVK